MDETRFFAPRSVKLPADKQQMIERLHRSDEDLVGKTALLSMTTRAIFRTSSMLERRGMHVLDGCQRTRGYSPRQLYADIAIVLMEIMMPEMDVSDDSCDPGEAYPATPIIAPYG